MLTSRGLKDYLNDQHFSANSVLVTKSGSLVTLGGAAPGGGVSTVAVTPGSGARVSWDLSSCSVSLL